MDQTNPYTMAAIIQALLSGSGTQVRGPTTGERFGEAMNSIGLPGSMGLSELEAYPVGFAAIGRGINGSNPSDRVRRAFDIIQQRTVPQK